MQTLNPSIEDCREFRPFAHSHRSPSAASERHPERTASSRPQKPGWLARLGGNAGEIIASFGAADLVNLDENRWELPGGSPTDRAAAQEWASLAQQVATQPGASFPLPAPGPPRAAKARPNRILIADDDALVRGSLAAVLESEGFVVEEARNGIEAVTRAIQQSPDLVLLDLNMPHWDGWTAFSQLDRVTPLLPVIVITARPNQYEKAVKLGVDAFMEKPLNFPILVRAIKRLAHEDEHRHMRRITNRGFVTQLLQSIIP